MGIARLWEEISSGFEVYGLWKNKWLGFGPYSVNYEAFLVRKK